MISVPVIFREFRVAARRKYTFGMRCIFAGFLLLVVLLFLSDRFLGIRTQSGGNELLRLFAWQLMFLVSVFAPALSSGCISDEKSQGTLGLLFLTHLNSADIVLGKFVSKGVDLLLLVLSATPLLFVPVLLGGVGWDQTLSVVASLFAMVVLALSVGVFTSTFSRTTGRAIVAAYAFLAAINIAAISLPEMKRSPEWVDVPFAAMIPDWVALVSPLQTLLGGVFHDSLLTLLGCAAVGALLVAASVWRLPATLQSEIVGLPFWRRWRRSRRAVKRHNSLVFDSNPVVWLHFGRHRSRWLLQWIVAAAACAWAVYSTSTWRSRTDALDSIIVCGLIALVALKLLIVIHIARTLATEKEEGALELLLLTPLTDGKIVRGKLGGLLARFALIWAVIFGLVVICGLMRMGPQLKSEELLSGIYFMGTTISSLIWAIWLAALISIRSKSAREALTWTILSTALLIWLINIATYVVGFSLVSATRGGLDVIGTIIATLIVVRIVVELGFAAVLYRSLVDHLRVYAART